MAPIAQPAAAPATVPDEAEEEEVDEITAGGPTENGALTTDTALAGHVTVKKDALTPVAWPSSVAVRASGPAMSEGLERVAVMF